MILKSFILNKNHRESKIKQETRKEGLHFYVRSYSVLWFLVFGAQRSVPDRQLGGQQDRMFVPTT